MKRLNYSFKILLILLPLALVSCKKEKQIDETIIGKWEVMTLKQVTFENSIKKSEVIIYYEANEMAYQFVDGSSGIYFENSEQHLYTWSLDGNVLTITDLYTEPLVVNAAIDGDILTWTYQETDTENISISYEYVVTARRIM